MSPRPLLALVIGLAAAAACSKSSSSSPPATGSDTPPSGGAAPAGSARTTSPTRHPGPALAGTDPTAPAPAGDVDRREQMRERIKAYDTNGDGMLSDDERYAMMASRAGMVLQRMDTDGDGKLTKVELDQSPAARRIGDFAAADLDHDGTLSADELGTAMVAQMKKAGGFRAWRGVASRSGSGSAEAGAPANPDDGSE